MNLPNENNSYPQAECKDVPRFKDKYEKAIAKSTREAEKSKSMLEIIMRLEPNK